MKSAARRRVGLIAPRWQGWGDGRASQVVELALSLPVLVLFVVGIFDFSGALTLKQKLTNAAREGARVAAADPASDMYASVPVAVSDAFQVVDNYLLSEKINDCGLSGGGTPPTPTESALTWTYTSTGSCPGSGITLTINRGYSPPPVNGIYLIGTNVTISYAYKWQFNSVGGLVGTRFLGPSTINTAAEAFNQN
ncbi:MAG: TadE/TadG family type IV pilus assembly protein [Candidatus Sulfotelmatobacter sp.]